MKRDKAILLMAAGQIVTWAGLYYVFPALLLRWEQSLGWSKTELTAAITLAVFLSALAAPLAGRLIDHGLGPLWMTGCTLVGSAALFLCAYIQQSWQFLALWALIGISLSGALYEPCFAMVTRARGSRAKQGIILITLIAGFAGSISFPSAHTLAEAFGWRMTLQIFAVVVALVGAPIIWTAARLLEADADHTARTEPHDRKPARGFLGNPVFWFLGIGFSLLAVVHGVTLHHLLSILDERRVDGEVAVLAASFIGPMQVAGRLVMVAVERHVSHHGIAAATFICMGLAVVLLMVAGGAPTLLVLFVILFGGSYGIVSIIRPVIARDLLGQAGFGAKSGALALLYLCGTASAPFAGALVWQAGGYDLVLPLLAGIAATGLVLYLVANRLAGRMVNRA
jgi:predicted MFS family arabinose efflux permease